MSIFPNQTTAGGLVIRDDDGNPTNPSNVPSAYVPAPGYVIDCPPTALPADCTARITAEQMNSVVSELIALAECFDPDGPWSCNSLTNLCAAFNVKWATIPPLPIIDGVTIIGAGTAADPWRVGALDAGEYY
ncbi:hypothetical protein [Bradyrhizobium sp. USDA 4508]